MSLLMCYFCSGSKWETCQNSFYDNTSNIMLYPADLPVDEELIDIYGVIDQSKIEFQSLYNYTNQAKKPTFYSLSYPSIIHSWCWSFFKRFSQEKKNQHPEWSLEQHNRLKDFGVLCLINIIIQQLKFKLRLTNNFVNVNKFIILGQLCRIKINVLYVITKRILTCFSFWRFSWIIK